MLTVKRSCRLECSGTFLVVRHCLEQGQMGWMGWKGRAIRAVDCTMAIAVVREWALPSLEPAQKR